MLITAAGGEILLQRWDSKAQDWVDDTAPTRARMRSSANVVTFDIHGSELDNTPAFGFAVVAFDVDLEAETVRAVDVVPDSRRFYKYRLANRPALMLTSTRLFATPTRPTPGNRFTVNLGVRRSDTNRAITSGTVACRVLVAKKQVPAKGSVAGGSGRCSFVVPAGTSGSALRGTITVRSDGKSVTEHFAYAIR